ncbi:MAG TPA: GNAT family N-acetyltransferase, partial [Streptosporangiaceae bacterium]|nr:GNAT family N-acetyltransferase [Streptosporangiaceae bacterium]
QLLAIEPEYRTIREAVEGPYADADELPLGELPEAAIEERYDEINDLMQIVRQVGFLNAFAGTFTADREKMVGPGPGARGSLLAPAGTAAQHYELPSRTGFTPVSSEGSSGATSAGTMPSPTPTPAYTPSPAGWPARRRGPLPAGWRPRRSAPPPPGPLATRLPAPTARAAAAAPPRQPPHVSVIPGDLRSLPARVGAIVRPDGARSGDAVGTRAPGDINADYVIHAAGPDFRDVGRAQGEAQLQAAYRSALAVADDLGVATVAFPLLSGDERRGVLQPQEIQALAERALRTTQTRVRNVYLVRPAPAARPGAPPTAGAEDLETLEAQRLQRIQQVTDRGRQAQRAYAGVRTARGIQDVDVPADAGGDTFYLSVMHPDAFGDRIRQVLGAAPTVGLMRDHLAAALQAEFDRIDRGERTSYRTALLFPEAWNRPGSQRVRQQILHSIATMGEWDTEAAENVVQFAALVWELPATLLGRWNVLDIGPRDLAPERYIQDTGEHFVVATSPRPVDVANVLYQSGELAGLPPAEDEPPPNVSLQRIETYVNGFEILRHRLAELTEASAALMTSAQADYGREIIEVFYAEMSDLWPLHEAAQAQHRLGMLSAALRNVIRNLESDSPVLSRPPQPVAARLGYLVASPRLVRRGASADSGSAETEALDTTAVDRALRELLERTPPRTPPAETLPGEVRPAGTPAVRTPPGEVRPAGTPAAEAPVAEGAADAATTTLGPEPGWVWLDQGRGVAFPADQLLHDGSRLRSTAGEWRVAEPGPGRGYAVHVGTGMIAITGTAGSRSRVAEISYGWVRNGSDLVHLSTGVVLRGPRATIGAAHQTLVDRLTADQRSGPAIGGGRERPQLNREDLLAWLLEHGGVAGPVPGLVTGAGWQELTDSDGDARWVWNSPGQIALALPAGLTRGTASGEGLLCLVDSLSQLLGLVLPAEQAAVMTRDYLADWLRDHLPVGNEALGQLLRGETIDVYSVLPVFTSSFNVRVQVFRRAGPGDRFDPPPRRTILPGPLVGPNRDQDGQPTPIVRLYWEGNHFEPVFPAVRNPVLRPPPGPASAAAPAPAASPATVTAAWQATRDLNQALEEINAYLALLQAPVAADIRPHVTAAVEWGEAIAGSMAPELSDQTARAMRTVVSELHAIRDQLAQMAGAAPVTTPAAGPHGSTADAGAAGLMADRALRSLTGNPAFALTATQKQDLLRALLGARASPRDLYAALLVLHDSDDQTLGELFGDGWLLAALEAGIPGGHELRPLLDRFLGAGDAAPAEPAGPHPPEEVQAGPIVLRRLRAADAGPLAAAVAASLDHLRPWVTWATPEAADPRAQLSAAADADQLWEAGTRYVYTIRAAADGPVAGTITLRRRADDDGLEIGYWIAAGHTRRGYATAAARALTEAAETLPGARRVEIQVDEANTGSAAIARNLGYRLERVDVHGPQAPGESGRRLIWVRDQFLTDRFWAGRFAGGRAALAEGRVQPQGRPAATFTWTVIDPSLAGLDARAELGEEQLRRIAEAVTGTSAGPLRSVLDALPPGPRQQAERSLAGAAVGMHALAQSGGRDEPLLQDAVDSLDKALAWLYYRAVDRAPSGGALTGRTVPLSDTEAAESQSALVPVSATTAGGFTDRGFEDAVQQAFLHDIDVAAGGLDRWDLGSLYSMEQDIKPMAQLAREVVYGVFGRFITTAPAVPELTILNAYADKGTRIDSWSDAEKLQQARGIMRKFLFKDRSRLAATLVAH